MNDAFTVTYDELVKAGAKFIERCRNPELSQEQVDGAKSAFVYHYLNSPFEGHEQAGAEALFRICMREYLFR